MVSDNLQNAIDRAAQTLDMDKMGALRGAQASLYRQYTDGDSLEITPSALAAAERVELLEVLPDGVDLEAELAETLNDSSDAADEVAEIEWQNAEKADLERIQPGESGREARENASLADDPEMDEEIAKLAPGKAGRSAREAAGNGRHSRTPSVDEESD